jgi:predicted transcriptional regulator
MDLVYQNARTVQDGWIAEDIQCYKISDDLKLICEIYHYDKVLKKPIHFTKMVENLAWVMSKFGVSCALDTLTDWGLVYREAGDLGNGRAGFMWHLRDYHLDTTKELYEKYWKDYRRDIE